MMGKRFVEYAARYAPESEAIFGRTDLKNLELSKVGTSNCPLVSLIPFSYRPRHAHYRPTQKSRYHQRKA